MFHELRIDTKEEFKEKIKSIESMDAYRKPLAFGICRVDKGQLSGKTLQATYPLINWNENFGSAAIFIEALRASNEKIDFSQNEQIFDIGFKFIDYAKDMFNPYLSEAVGNEHKNVQIIKTLDNISKDGYVKGTYKLVFIYEDLAPKSVEAVYLKLYALSLNKAPLRTLNLNGAFGILSNVAWCGNTPYELDWLRANEMDLKFRSKFPVIDYVDKFPRFLMHIIPADNTRILDSSKVRMGASVFAGTTVMPGASYINFNAGTTGSCMVEGRISSSAIVGAGSDIGGGASILGVLSGTDGNPISVGKNCLLGANSVTGIPLGDGCIVDAGVSILEGTKVLISKIEEAKIKELNPLFTIDGDEAIFKAKDLSNMHGLHFRQNSQTGKISATRSKKEVKLNEDLH